ncbi:MAG: sialidase family protein [Bacteroidota bacterium]|nr:sialidase family protein [Bacteroidota bacterium]
MKKVTLTILIAVSFSMMIQAQQREIPVFISGQGGYQNYRIPALIVLPDGDMLAFCEGRVAGSDDFGNIDIVMKRSRDQGHTWSGMQVVADAGSLQAGNPAPVVDLTDPAYPHGRIFLFYNTGNNHESEVRKGNGRREVFYKTSVDNGVSWSEPVNITTAVHPPDWRSYANTPGHAMQFARGKYKGRIFVAANHSSGDPQKHFADYRAHGYYTDDHGPHFHLSADVEMPGGNENTAAELSDDRLMLNFRNQTGDTRSRAVAISSNGGASWDTVYSDPRLPDPVCQGSILTIGERKGKNIIAFCNDADTRQRDNLTLRISFDDGRTWDKHFVLGKSPENYRGDFTAYSDIAKISGHKIGVLYEKDNYSKIVFTTVDW